MEKSPDAFRTISEVADWLGVEAHVLRFWETKFAQVKPVKRAGGRRYYRPADMALLGGIRRLLHEDGMTIRGVQKILRERGVGHVASLSPELAVDGVEPSPRARAARGARPDGPSALARPGAAAETPIVDAGPAAVAAADDAAPSLPFDLPHTPPAAAAAVAVEAERPEGGLLEQPDENSVADGGGATRPAFGLIRAGPVRLDPATAAPILARARDLARRLRDTPE